MPDFDRRLAVGIVFHERIRHIHTEAVHAYFEIVKTNIHDEIARLKCALVFIRHLPFRMRDMIKPVVERRLCTEKIHHVCAVAVEPAAHERVFLGRVPNVVRPDKQIVVRALLR